MASFIKTQRECEKLIYEDYSYNKVRNGTNGKRYWRCDELQLKCGGTVITDGGDNVSIGKPHNHAPSPTKVKVKTVKTTIKERAASSSNTPRDLVNAALEGVHDGVKIHLPELKNLQKTVSRKRKKTGILPLVPHSLEEIAIPPRLRVTQTATQENFILHDSGIEDPYRIIIFGCTTDVNRLIQCSTWVVDGTFKSSPNLWSQLWVIHGIFKNKTIPLIFTFLSNKNEVTYERTLTAVLTKIDAIRPGARPNTIIIDFEQAVVTAFKRLMPNITIHGCFFHFSQAIWRKIKELGLVQIYRRDEYFRTIMKSFCVLTFVPPVEVLKCFEMLADELLESFGQEEVYNNFVDYFISTWVGRTIPRKIPLFSIAMWNCHNITLEGLPRTTNSAESWHHAFSSIFSCHHPNPYTVIEKLLREQMRADFLCTRLETGQIVELYTRVEYRNANERLLNVIRDFNNRNIGDFLQVCSNYIHYNE